MNLSGKKPTFHLLKTIELRFAKNLAGLVGSIGRMQSYLAARQVTSDLEPAINGY